MIGITFLPYSDSKDFSSAIKEYEDIWKADGEKIVTTWERVSGFTFVEKKMNALVWAGISHAPPLCLRDEYEFKRRKSVLVHELGHCLLNKRMKKSPKFESHKVLYLVLYDILVDLYGEDYAKETVEQDNKWNATYKEAWEFALSFKTKDERQRKFKEMLNS